MVHKAARSRSRKPVKVKIARPFQPGYYLGQTRKALNALELALEHAKAAGAPYLVERIRLARSSAYGAVRNAGYRVTREMAARGMDARAQRLRAGQDDDRA